MLVDIRNTILQPNLPFEAKESVLKMVFAWIDDQTVGRIFGPRDIQDFIVAKTGGEKQPQDGTITRYIREYNAQGGFVINTSRSKSKYMKNANRK